jgi:hypothetical protein
MGLAISWERMTKLPSLHSLNPVPKKAPYVGVHETGSNSLLRPADLYATVAGCCTSSQLDFSSLIESSLMNSSIVGGILRVMAAQRRRKVKKDLDSAGTEGSSDTLLASNEPVLRLARLIGRQIAREQFERQNSRDRKAFRQKSGKPT